MILKVKKMQHFKIFLMFSFLFFLQTALHWAAKSGNEDIVKLIAGTHKADVNARTVIFVQIQNCPTNKYLTFHSFFTFNFDFIFMFPSIPYR